MIKKLMTTIVAAGMLTALLTSSLAAAPQTTGNANLMPPSEEKIQAALTARKVIPQGASAQKAQKILNAYLQQKLNPTVNTQYPSPKDMPNPKNSKSVKDREQKFQGNSGAAPGPRANTMPNAQALPLDSTAQVGKILVLLVEFGQDPGPLAGNLPQPADPNRDYWVANFDNDHYTKMLFDKTPGANSLANFYLAQSDGRFSVDGKVYGWIKLPYSEAYYGADAAGGTDNANGPAWRIVQDAIKAAEKEGIQIPYKDYDADGDGYVDSLMVIHAGAGQEGGGGAQGDNAIWSHSWFADYANLGFKTADGTMVGPYTIEPEDGAVGVFAHEYGHQLGLPDLYDTTYLGESSTGFYSLMSSGSWLGKPLGTQPANLDIWSKMVMGWTPDLTEVYAGPSGIKDFFIHSDETYATFSKGFRVNLPAHPVTTDINTPFAGANEYWSTMGDDLSTTMTRSVDLSGVSKATLNFKTWYQTEYDYDYGFVEVSADNGATFSKIPGNITRDIGGGVPGIDGFSNGWVDAVFDLSAYAGKQIQLRFHYLTDGGVAYKGWAVDNITIPEVNFFDDAENPSGWTFAGFRQFAGTETVNKTHYYMGQLVRPFGTNAGLNWAYNYYDNGSQFERMAYEPGVLLWYRDTALPDNNVGLHPGQGRLLLVDAHYTPMLQSTGSPFRTRVQVYDAPFGVSPTSPLAIHDVVGKLINFGSQKAVPLFDDSKSYYDLKAPYNSVKTPTYGLKLTVKGISEDGSAARIGIDY
ncbi:MAG TPA: immune inhibitor A domain-containing protein [Desulfobacteria bacterium]|nr:immune inhibitor A domain-containing protein [Desulfobacteria bacterium]